MKLRLYSALFFQLFIFSAGYGAQTDPQIWVDEILSAYRQHTPITTDATLSQHSAIEIQKQVVQQLKNDLGPVIGYKAGLTNPAAQKRFNSNQPVLGTLLENMILPNGTRVSVSNGVHLLLEADLLVRVKDFKINHVETLEQAYQSIDLVTPFLEIPDLIIEKGQAITGPILTAINSGAKLGVRGKSVTADRVTIQQLAEFSVSLNNANGSALQSTGHVLMQHPLNVVLWIVEESRRRGIKLKPGDWLSLGSLTPPFKAQAGKAYQATYTGLGDQVLTVNVQFIQ